MEAIPILFIIFSAVTAWVLGPKYMQIRHEERLKALEFERGAKNDVKLLTAEKTDLEARVQHLETIVCSLDFELNAKLNRISTRMMRLPSGNAATEAPIGLLPPPTSLEAGDRLGKRYVIQRRLGVGGMGEVFLARDETLGEPVALKLIRDMHLRDPGLIERFRREVSAARRINHPNIVRLYDLGEEEGVLFISMEYVEGESLRALLRRQRTLPIERTASIARQICDALDAAHRAGVVHRDLKPENLLFDGEQRVKVIDFGIARLSDLEGLTATSVIMGTPEYMSPEQIRGGTLDARADLYALGVILFEALTGSPPFTGPSPIAVSFAHCTDPVPSVRAAREELSEDWEAFLTRALAKDPAARFDDATQMGQAIPS